ncbi:glyceraldehyde-3-phosphate dehydrogenase, testis-specific-like [Rosa chinensis]|uniref:glyceraldehyde-3-phosphate dehydrogenase, testis-specific-like n=1 Tax=Rosa chinensis TaxID=74649 RepID=UPI000D08BF0C|nr:glyceraldehyde-3-phosphate dehydrogenase, testis-specific-like [Rosa chinensis]
MQVQVGADECEYRSAHFRGPCFGRNHECYICCQEEGFDRGSCKGFLNRHCICTKPCGSPGGPLTYEPPPPPPPPEEDVPSPPEEDVPPPPEEDVPPTPEEEAPIN